VQTLHRSDSMRFQSGPIFCTDFLAVTGSVQRMVAPLASQPRKIASSGPLRQKHGSACTIVEIIVNSPRREIAAVMRGMVPHSIRKYGAQALGSRRLSCFIQESWVSRSALAGSLRVWVSQFL